MAADSTADAHDHDQGHGHAHAALQADPTVARVLRIVVGVIVAVTVIGLFVWRPDGGASVPDSFSGQGERVNATVIGIEPIECAGFDVGGGQECREITFDLTSGPNQGGVGRFEQYPEAETRAPQFEPGDKIVVVEYMLGDTGEVAHTFADLQRTRPLLLLVALFVVAVVALGRWQGLRAIGGLVVSAVMLFAYVFPALLDGKPPLAVAMVAASVIAFAALYLAHGINDTTTVALLGTLGALAVTGVLAAVFTAAANITGLASEDQIYLLVSSEGIDVRGLVLAGIVLGSLGVLDDVTVTQVSAVASLREANPGLGVRELYTRGVRIGRDHIASTVNTLVLAYAGASLPLLLYYSNIGITLSEAATSEVVATEIVRTLVGSIGLVTAVPITTFLAAIVVTGTGFGRARPLAAPTVPPPVPASPPVATPTDDGGSDAGWDDFTPTAEDF